jgi:hypothetical protein
MHLAASMEERRAQTPAVEEMVVVKAPRILKLRKEDLKREALIEEMTTSILMFWNAIRRRSRCRTFLGKVMISIPYRSRPPI